MREPRREDISPDLQLLHLCGRQPGMQASRYSLLALTAYRGAVSVAEAAKALGMTKGGAKSLLRRTSKDGWIRHKGPGNWALDVSVVTDVAALNAAVSRGELDVAETLALKIGPPLVSVEGPSTEWVDNEVYAIKRSVRGDLTEAADKALAAAVERWPRRMVFREAVNRLYDE